MEEELEERKTKHEIINEIIDFMAQSDDAPIDFKLMKARNDFINTTMDLFLHENFAFSEDFMAEKEELINFFEEGTKTIQNFYKRIGGNKNDSSR